MDFTLCCWLGVGVTMIMPGDCRSQQDGDYEEEEYPSSTPRVVTGFQCATASSGWPLDPLANVADLIPSQSFQCSWGSNCEAPLQNRFSVLDDWATALRAHHIKDAVHGNLTPESVGIVHGRGTLRTLHLAHLPGHEPPDGDVYGARWAATELFQIDNGNPTPTKMSDVYSFACLMLQMLTGEVPYCGTKRPEQVVYLKYLGREPIDTQTPKVADHYVAFMRWCWSPEPEKRPTMESVIEFIHGERKKLAERRN